MVKYHFNAAIRVLSVIHAGLCRRVELLIREICGGTTKLAKTEGLCWSNKVGMVGIRNTLDGVLHSKSHDCMRLDVTDGKMLNQLTLRSVGGLEQQGLVEQALFLN